MKQMKRVNTQRHKRNPLAKLSVGACFPMNAKAASYAMAEKDRILLKPNKKKESYLRWNCRGCEQWVSKSYVTTFAYNLRLKSYAASFMKSCDVGLFHLRKL